MADNILKTRLISAHNTLAYWQSSTEIIKKGEVCYTVEATGTDGDKFKIVGMKIGDGIHNWSELPEAVFEDKDSYELGADGSATAGTTTASVKIDLVKNGTTSDSQTITIPAATTAKAGLMTKADKTKLNDIATGANKVVIAEGGTNGTIKVTTNDGSPTNVAVHGLAAAAYKTTATILSASGINLPTEKAVADYVSAQIEALPEPMVFKGSLGTGGTTTALPAAAAANTGWTYKVITAGSYGPSGATTAAKIGDMFISDGSAWIYIPSADEPSGTVTSIKIQATSPIVIDNNAAITTSGTRTLSHADSGVSAGTYGSTVAQTPGYNSTFNVPYVTVDAKGHVTSAGTQTVKIPASDNTNYYTTAVNGATTSTGYTVSVAGNNSAVKGSVTIPAATSATFGVVKGDGTTSHYLNGAGAWTTPPDTKYSASASDRIALSGTTFYHTTAITAGKTVANTASTADAFGESVSFSIPEISYDKWGHTTAVASKAFKVSLPSTAGLGTSAKDVKSVTFKANTNSGNTANDFGVVLTFNDNTTASSILTNTIILDGNFTS